MVVFTRKENSQTIGVFEGNDLTVFVHCATDIIIDHSFEIKSDGQWLLYCLTKTGNLYLVRKDHVDHSARRVSGHVDEEIFSDLLGQDDVDSEIQLNFSSQPVFILKESHTIIRKIEDPVGLCVSSKHLVVITGNTIEYTVHLYEKSEHGTHNDEKIMKVPKNNCMKNMKAFDSVLVKMVTCLCIDDGDSTCSHNLKIDITLFKQLFGEDTALLNSPVLLFTQLDGSVYFSPFSSFVPRYNINRSSLEDVSFRDSQKLLCQMSSSVTEIALVTLDNDGDKGSITALCVCGHNGQVTVFRSRNGKPEYSISEFFISSPVLSVISFHNRLYYTSGHNVFESTLGVDTGVNELLTNKQLQVSLTRVLSARYITEIHAASSNGYIDSQESTCCLHCSSLNGEVNVIETSAWIDFECDTLVIKEDSLTDILISIDDINRTREQMKNRSKTQENTLKQLGVASYLIASYVPQTRKSLIEGEIIHVNEKTGASELPMSDNLPILVVFSANVSRNVESKLTEICVEVTNQMSVMLSSDWTLRASLNSTTGDSHIVSSTMKIDPDWKPNEKLILTLPVSFNRLLTGCKLLVKATYVANSMEPNPHSERNNTNKVCICCPLFEIDIDIFDCLLSSSTVTATSENVPQYTNKLYSQIKKQAHFRSSQLIDPRVNAGFDDLTVHTSSGIRFTAYLSGERTKSNEASQALLGKLLGKTLSDVSGINPSDCHLMTTVGHAIHMSIMSLKRDTSSRHSEEEALNEIFEVNVRSTPSIAAAVNRAIKRRESHIIQTVWMRSIPEISTSYARKAIQTAQEIVNQLGSHKVDEATFTSAFQKLRNIQLY